MYMYVQYHLLSQVSCDTVYCQSATCIQQLCSYYELECPSGTACENNYYYTCNCKILIPRYHHKLMPWSFIIHMHTCTSIIIP